MADVGQYSPVLTSANETLVERDPLSDVVPFSHQLRILFYLLKPEEMYFPTLEKTPNFIVQAFPLYLILIVVEMAVIRLVKSKEVPLNDYVTNLTSTALQDGFSQLICRGSELFIYSWLYNNYRFFTMPWDNFYTYLFAFFCVDYFAYWWHRMSHEIALVWAAHEFHHNSEHYNLSLGIRLAATMRFYRWLFFVPTAFMGLPVSTMWAHSQVGFIFTACSHTALVPSLGKVIPVLGDLLEFIFMTPTHHKVHHAMNVYAIDKNYGAVFILWDRLHGTFAQLREDEELFFGSLTPLPSTSLLTLQNKPYQNLWNKVRSMDTFGDKLRALFYGPGWYPTKPRLGLMEDLPDMRGRPEWNVSQPIWLRLYLLLNSACLLVLYMDVVSRAKSLTPGIQLWAFVNLYFGYWSLGAIYDYKVYGAALDLVRVLMLLVGQLLLPVPLIAVSWLGRVTTIIAWADIALLPLVAYHVYERNKTPTDDVLYMKKLEKLNFIKPKGE